MSPREPELPSAVSYMQDQYTAPSSRTSRASQLAVELATEKRLIDEQRELQAENDDLKSTTSVGTIDWYVKWVATFLSVSGIFLMSAGLVMQGQIAYVVSAIGWIFVGVQWSDLAIMIGKLNKCYRCSHMDLVRALTS